MVSCQAERSSTTEFYWPQSLMIKTLVILLSCTATARACESTDKATMTSVDANANAKRIGLGLGIGGIAGAAVLPTFLLAIGLTPAGPLAGGWFAASQGAGVAACVEIKQ